MTKKASLLEPSRVDGSQLPAGASVRRSSAPSPASQAAASDAEYKVGPGCPPREYQFRPGQSGNPKGRKPKPASPGPDLKRLLEKALNTKVTLKRNEREQIATKAAVGIEQLVNQFAKGDWHARRDLIVLADKLGIDLVAGQAKGVQEALAPNHQAILEAYVERQYNKVVQPPPVLAPPELLDDDPDEENGN